VNLFQPKEEKKLTLKCYGNVKNSNLVAFSSFAHYLFDFPQQNIDFIALYLKK